MKVKRIVPYVCAGGMLLLGVGVALNVGPACRDGDFGYAVFCTVLAIVIGGVTASIIRDAR